MVNNIQELLSDANNVYRTREYIVIQKVFVEDSFKHDALVFSEDIYIPRSKKNDNIYEKYFSNRAFLDGKRIRTNVSFKRYV